MLTKDAGECVICLEELLQGDTIARLPCLCIYHKRYERVGRASSAPSETPEGSFCAGGGEKDGTSSLAILSPLVGDDLSSSLRAQGSRQRPAGGKSEHAECRMQASGLMGRPVEPPRFKALRTPPGRLVCIRLPEPYLPLRAPVLHSVRTVICAREAEGKGVRAAPAPVPSPRGGLRQE